MNSIYLDFWEPLKDKILAHLNRYLVADEVEINDPNDQWTTLSLQGPRAQTILEDSSPIPYCRRARSACDGSIRRRASLCRARRSHGYDGFDLIVQNSCLQSFAKAWHSSAPHGSVRGRRMCCASRLVSPRYGVDFNEENLIARSWPG
jgi:glycine cleavage system aminomethyltransferase T